MYYAHLNVDLSRSQWITLRLGRDIEMTLYYHIYTLLLDMSVVLYTCTDEPGMMTVDVV